MSEQSDLLPLRSPEEGGLAFELVRRGYDRDQVENHLGWLEDQLRNAEAARDAAEQAAATASAEAEAAREELELGRPLWHEFGDRITQILTLAEEQGTEIRTQRSQEADELLAEARQSSIDTQRQCAAEVQAASDEANQIMTNAHAEASAIVTSAQAEADSLLARTQQQVAEQERISSRRLAELERQRDAVSAQLTRMQEALAQALSPANFGKEAAGEAEPVTHVELPGSEYGSEFSADSDDYVAGSSRSR